jgi:hypothetical protein
MGKSFLVLFFKKELLPWTFRRIARQQTVHYGYWRNGTGAPR